MSMDIKFFSFLLFALLFGRTIEYYVDLYIHSPMIQSITFTFIVMAFFTGSSLICEWLNVSSVKVRPKIWIISFIIALLLSVTLQELNILPAK
jgi:hypothetical protein